MYTCIIFNHFNKQILLLLHKHCVILMCIILIKTCKILHNWYHNTYTLIATYFLLLYRNIGVIFLKMAR